MSKRFYTGVGSRETPEDVLIEMRDIASDLSSKGFTLRSGGANGADKAFALGTSRKDIYLPWKGFNGSDSPLFIDRFENFDEADDIARSIHPNFGDWKIASQLFHIRNVYQVLGRDLNTPSEFVVCWTLKAKPVGGTRTAIILANRHNIPIYNLGKIAGRVLVEQLLENL